MGRDVADFGEYAATRWGSLFRTAYLLTGDHGLAEDLMQTALVKCYVAWPRLRKAESADAYVRKTLTNTYFSWRRKKSWGREHPTDVLPEHGIEDMAADVSVRQVVMRALAQLPPKQRAAGDRGSYVGWMEAGSDGPNEAVVYDTADQAEVFRTSDGNQRGCYPDPNDNGAAVPTVNAIDGDVVYVCNSDGVTTWSLTTGEKLDNRPVKAVDGVYDAANGYLVEDVPGRPYPVPVVSPASGAGETRFPELLSVDLSPNATYVMGTPSDSPGGEIGILDRATKEDATPLIPGDYYQGTAWWLDDDRYVLQTIPDDLDDVSAVEMLVCSISSGECDVAASFHVEPGEFSMPLG